MDSNHYCSRCGRRLAAGVTRYVVTISLTADFDGSLGSGAAEGGSELEEIFRLAAGKSEDELMDEVVQKLSFWLCKPCRDEWVKAPLGEVADGRPNSSGQMH